MSAMDADDFVVTSNSDVGSSPSTPESVGAPAASVTAHEPEGTADASPATDPETHETPVAERERGADGKYTKKDSVQARIDKAVAAQRAAERERDAFRAQLDAARQPAPPVTQEPAAPNVERQSSNADGPQLAEFTSYEDWVDARAEWKAEQKWQRAQAESAQQIARQQREQAVLTHTERIQAFAAKTPDYFDKIQEAARLPVSAAMEAAIIASDHGPAIAYFLATHPEEGAQLAYDTQSVPATAAAVVRQLLESKINASQAANTGPAAGGHRPNVPAPIKPVGSAPVVADPPLDTLDVDAFIARENAREQAERKARYGVK